MLQALIPTSLDSWIYRKLHARLMDLKTVFVCFVYLFCFAYSLQKGAVKKKKNLNPAPNKQTFLCNFLRRRRRTGTAVPPVAAGGTADKNLHGPKTIFPT